MPSSYYQNIPVILDIITELKPLTILDVGIGYGKYGNLIREYVDDWRMQVTIDGVEIHQPYLEHINRNAYNTIHVTDIRSAILQKEYDLVLLIDVIEHFPKEDAMLVIHKAREISEHILISTPHGMMKQGPRNGNEHEEHLSGWEAKELPGKDYSNKWSIIKLV